MEREKKQIRISIIIPSFNQGMFLEETLLSVINQPYKNVEILVMDGGSTDNSVEIIKKYEPFISYWQSQKDNGQSDAINQGFKRATGEYVTWLNSDDVLLPNALTSIVDCINRNPSVNWFLGNVLWMNKAGHIIRVGKVEKENKFWNKHYLFSNGGPSAFMRKSRLMELGLLREDFHYMMDTELWYRYLSYQDYFVRIPVYCWGLRLHENAKMSGHNFAGSVLADKSHPSWRQKQKEHSFLKETYPIDHALEKLWRVLKVLRPTFYTRFLHRKLLSVHYLSIKVR